MLNREVPTLMSTLPRYLGSAFTMSASSSNVWQLVAQTNVVADLPVSLLSWAAQALSLVTDSRVAEPPRR